MFQGFGDYIALRPLSNPVIDRGYLYTEDCARLTRLQIFYAVGLISLSIAAAAISNSADALSILLQKSFAFTFGATGAACVYLFYRSVDLHLMLSKLKLELRGIDLTSSSADQFELAEDFYSDVENATTTVSKLMDRIIRALAISGAVFVLTLLPAFVPQGIPLIGGPVSAAADFVYTFGDPPPPRQTTVAIPVVPTFHEREILISDIGEPFLDKEGHQRRHVTVEYENGATAVYGVSSMIDLNVGETAVQKEMTTVVQITPK